MEADVCSGAQLVVRYLEEHGIGMVAGIPGGSNLPLYLALGRSSISHVAARHEQGAGFVAMGLARGGSLPGVCLATAGPGATNLITALADARMDGIALVAITGQVPLAMQGTDAFQEVDIVRVAGPVCKAAYAVQSAADLEWILPEAFTLAAAGRPGPVLIDIPKDVQLQNHAFTAWADSTPCIKENSIAPGSLPAGLLQEAMELVNKAQRPVIIAGAGAISSADILLEFVEHSQIPVAHTLLGLGTLPSGHPLNIGMLGMHGAAYTNLLLERADLLLVIGARFGDRATGRLDGFCSKARVIHIDNDQYQLNRLKKADLAIWAESKELLAQLHSCCRASSRQDWINEVTATRERFPVDTVESESPGHVSFWVRLLGTLLNEDTLIVTDVGQHQMWTAQSYPFKRPGRFLTSGGLGTMGYGLPVAIGAALSDSSPDVVCISGDGSILMNIQELALLAETRANLKLCIFDNGGYGLVRQQQELFFDRVYCASRFEGQTDFAAIARGFGIPGATINARDFTGNPDDLVQYFGQVLRTPGPQVIHILVDEQHNVYPMVAPGQPNSVMINAEPQTCFARTGAR